MLLKHSNHPRFGIFTHPIYLNKIENLKLTENLFSLEGKIALVTGGAKGIGAMISQGLIEAGAKVYVSSRSAEDCASFAKKMNEMKANSCVALAVDLSKTENIDQFVNVLSEKEDSLDILINNAGATWGAPLEEFPEKGWDKIMNLNVKGVFFLTKALLPMLKKNADLEDPSRIVMISSVAATSSNSMMSYSYGPSKAAVTQLGKMLAKDLVKDHILVNSIGPGFFPSKMTAHFDIEQMIQFHPVGRVGRAEDIAGLVIYLCSKAGSFMTGNYIPLDGGFLIN